MDASKPILFYDIASGPPRRTFAPNPWKTRYALNFKNVHYRTEWVELPDVISTRKSLGAAPNRLLPDGSDFYTLPVIKDLSNNGEVVGDTFDIAVYLDKTYLNGPTLLPPGTAGVTAAFNVQIDALFTPHSVLFSHGMPFNPDLAEQCKRQFEERWNTSWENMGVKGEARVAMWESLKTALGELSKAYRYSSGPFLSGDTATYADIIVGGWLGMAKATVSEDEWQTLCSWHEGRWGKVHSALEKYAEIK